MWGTSGDSYASLITGNFIKLSVPLCGVADSLNIESSNWNVDKNSKKMNFLVSLDI